MLRNLMLLFFTISAFHATQAQNFQEADPMDFYRIQKKPGDQHSRLLAEEEMDGSPYLKKDFQNGVIFTKDRKKYIDIPLRYNIYNNEMEFKNEQGDILALSNPAIIDLIEIGADHFVFRPYLYSSTLKTGYFMVLVAGKVNLLQKYNLYVEKAQPAGAYTEPQPARFISKPNTYFLHHGTNEAKIILGKKELPELFPEKRMEVKAFIKKNKLKTSDAEDLIKLVQHYNQL